MDVVTSGNGGAHPQVSVDLDPADMQFTNSSVFFQFYTPPVRQLFAL